MSAPAPALPVPHRDCGGCPRLVAYREEQRAAEPHWHNAPVPSFGGLDARLLIVGLAPGRRGANRTGRPFTGDVAGDLLYRTLGEFGFARGAYGAEPGDGLSLHDCRITNVVRCVPPQNRPTAAETAACRGFLAAEIAAMTGLRAILALGGVAHGAVLRTLGLRAGAFAFAHGAVHRPSTDGSRACSTATTARASTPTPGDSRRRCSPQCSPRSARPWPLESRASEWSCAPEGSRALLKKAPA